MQSHMKLSENERGRIERLCENLKISAQVQVKRIDHLEREHSDTASRVGELDVRVDDLQAEAQA